MPTLPTLPATDTNVIQGYTPQIKLGGTQWELKSGEPKLHIATVRGDTTFVGFDEVNHPNKRGFSFSFEAFRYSDLNPHGSPANIGLSTGTWKTALIYYPTGDTSTDSTAWRSGTVTGSAFVVEEYSESFNAESGLVTCRVSGKSSGQIKMPGES
jgi:hypothetical protein